MAVVFAIELSPKCMRQKVLRRERAESGASALQRARGERGQKG